MLLWHSVKTATRSLAGSRLRTSLTTLGVVIGVAAVVAMIALGEGARQNVERSIRSLGTNLLTIRPGAPQLGHIRGAGAVETLTMDDARALLDLPGVVRIAPEASRAAQVEYFAANKNTGITGTTPDYLAVRSFEVGQGTFFTDSDVRGRRRVAVLGATVAEDLFGGLDPLGQRISIRGIPFMVLGVLAEKGDAAWMNPDDQVVVPVTTLQQVLFGIDSLSTISIEVEDNYPATQLTDDITRLLRARHRIAPGAEPDFNIRTQTEMLQTMTQVTMTFTALLGGVAAVSLLVGGIGIMNIMLVSVRERTREIGVRKAVGARRRDILVQFLIESVIVSALGGLGGIALGYGAAALLAHFGGWATVVPAYAVGLAVGTSVGVGLIFGVWPAHQASRLDPVDALRYE